MFLFNKKWFPGIVAALSLFVGPGVLWLVGYDLGGAKGPAIFRFHPVAYILIFLTIYNIFKYHYRLGLLKEYLNYTICVFVVLMYSLLFASSKNNLYLFNVLFCPALVIYNFQFINNKTDINVNRWMQVMKICKIFFFSECLLAVFENVVRFKFFPINETVLLFRSNAFQGHPLNNSLFVIFFSLFFYVYEKQFIWRMVIIGVTVGALASFGVRSGLVAYSLGIVMISVKPFENGRLNLSLQNVLMLLIFVVAVTYIVFYTSLGTRITTQGGFNDQSSEARFVVYGLFSSVSFDDIMWGTPQETIDYLMYIRGIKIIENFWIIWVFKYGIVFTAYLSISFLFFMYKLTRIAFGTRRYEQLVVLGSFMLAASSNNSLAVNTTVMTGITILCLTQQNLLQAHLMYRKKPKLQPTAVGIVRPA